MIQESTTIEEEENEAGISIIATSVRRIVNNWDEIFDHGKEVRHTTCNDVQRGHRDNVGDDCDSQWTNNV